MTSQLLTEIQNTVNSSPITLGKVATNVVHAGFIAIKYW